MIDFTLRSHGARLLAVCIALSFPQASSAAEITILCSNGFKAVIGELAPQFERATGHALRITYSVSAELKRRIEAGEPFDIAVLTDTALDDVIKQGRVVGGTRAVTARSPIAIAIRAGAAKPDVRTVAALEAALRAATSIAFAKE